MNLENMARCNGCGCEWKGSQKPFPSKIPINKRFVIGKAPSAVGFNAEIEINIVASDGYERQRIDAADLCDTCRANLKKAFLKAFTGEDAAAAVKEKVLEHIEGIRESLSTYGSRTDAALKETITFRHLEANFEPMYDAMMKARRARKGGR